MAQRKTPLTNINCPFYLRKLIHSCTFQKSVRKPSERHGLHMSKFCLINWNLCLLEIFLRHGSHLSENSFFKRKFVLSVETFLIQFLRTDFRKIKQWTKNVRNERAYLYKIAQRTQKSIRKYQLSVLSQKLIHSCTLQKGLQKPSERNGLHRSQFCLFNRNFCHITLEIFLWHGLH